MSAALIQTCNKCKKPFVKEYGCNKMHCSCGNLQCYVCGESISDYSHFDRGRSNGSKCPLNDDVRRVESKIRQAREEAVKKVLEDVEGVSVEDVKVDMGNIGPRPNRPIIPEALPGIIEQLPHTNITELPPGVFHNVQPMPNAVFARWMPNPLQNFGNHPFGAAPNVDIPVWNHAETAKV